ncbi:Taurine catabolism dioxygenase TauD/TfdA [Phaffia rhodozyma]|uniref:Taurine catabolism dioxygenase TauD/TfdA n=1 Tax=Phaffia rhodozyma TaxID=264483 RepID=A0A0F7SLC4_PHARH|nr:Taurine catabolism dioxygenase TauD/TfdA [Phaffia rhodozyma]
MPVANPSSSQPSRLNSSQALSAYPSVDLTPSIGTEISSLQLRDLLSLPSEESARAIRDLAILVSERGVVFLRDQDISPTEQNELVARMGKGTGRPAESGNHVHPLAGTDELGEIFKITPEFNGATRDAYVKSTRASNLWHSDITFEPHPSDYAILKLNVLPTTGGDTVWASAYEAYDRLSPAFQTFLSGLTATHIGSPFLEKASREGLTFAEPRGHPENKGQILEAVHPVIRTNPVTGWRGLFVNKAFTKRINELTVDESENLLSYLHHHITLNHDLQVRFKWSQNAIALWDNRSTFHCATNDYGFTGRSGDRVISVGERPFFDPSSVSRADSLRKV